MKNHIHAEIRDLRRLMRTHRVQKNWLKVDELKHKIRLLVKQARNR